MFILSLTYVVPLEDADKHMEAVHSIARYEITEVAFTTVAPGFENLKA